MKAEILVNNRPEPASRYLSWAPSPARIRLSDATGATQAVKVTLSAESSPNGGGLVFFSALASNPKATLTIQLPLDGSTVTFFVAGKFGKPSRSDGDVSIVAKSGANKLASVAVMVRIRKNAATLTPAERDRFVDAFARLNNRGTGRFADFRNMHVNGAASAQAHGNPGFLSWHRAYLLDLERELQNIDPGVALPYWRFDKPAPFIFTPEFLGTSDPLGTVSFAQTNPLQFWSTDGVQGINRRPLFNTATQGGINLLTEAQTLALGADFVDFENLEGDPHGSAHVSFGGSISSIGTAAKDPLFFLLHANVDRLWAKWQRKFGRFDPSMAAAYDSSPSNPIGHRLPDTMWPWNGVTGAPRPTTAPGGALAASLCTASPGPKPRVMDCLDYQGVISPNARLGFDYDDVRFR
ncbi:tyrosinase family protein [Variovorax paradoxus]|nr:tyrosinase family protein [Variovorax paradoxus]